MTTMPDLPAAGRGAAVPVTATATAAQVAPTRPVEPPRLETIETASSRAESRRLAAERSELETRTRTAEGLKQALDQTSREVKPQVADLRRLYDEPPRTRAEENRVLEEEKLAAAAHAATRTRQAAARIAAMRIAQQEKAARTAEEVRSDAEQLAELNREALASPAASRRDVLEARRLADDLATATGATVAENSDGTHDLAIGGRPLIRGTVVDALDVVREPSPGEAPAANTGPAGAPVVSTSEGAVTPTETTPTETSTAAAGVGAPVSVPLPRIVGDRRSSTPGNMPPRPQSGADEATSSWEGDTNLPELQVRWADGTPALVGGRLGGFVTADRTLLRPAAEGLDRMAAAIRESVGAAQALGRTSAGVPGPPLLTGDSAWDLRLADGIEAADVASGAGMPVTETTTDLAGSVDASADSPEAALLDVQAALAAATASLTRRTEVTGAFDVALGLASARIGQNVSLALGAIGDVSRKDVVAALHQANASMVFAGAAARQAIATGIPLLVGSSDPSVATASGIAPLEGPAGEVLSLTVVSVTGGTGFSAGSLPTSASGDPSGPSGASAPGVTVVGAPGASAPVGDGAGDDGASSGVLATVPMIEPITVGPSSLDDSGDVGVSGDAAALPIDTPPVPGETAAPVELPAGIGGTAGPETPTPGFPPIPGGPASVSPTGLPVAPAAAETSMAFDPSPAPVASGVEATSAGLPAVAVPAETAQQGTTAQDRTLVSVGGEEVSSPTATLTGVRPGLDVVVRAPGQVVLAATPDPGPALERVQGLVDAVGTVTSAVAVGVTSAPTASSSSSGSTMSALASMWSSVSSFASSFSASGPATADHVSEVLSAVAAPLATTVTEAFVDPAGRPIIPGTSIHKGRIALDREAFAHEYVTDATGVEGAIAAVARSVAATSDAASDPKVGALAVRIQAEIAPEGEYTIDEAATDQRLDARRNELDRKAGALQSLLEHLEDQSGWLGAHLL